MRLARVVLAGLLGGLAGLAFGPVFGGAGPAPGELIVPICTATGIATIVALTAVLMPRLPPALVAVGGTVIVAAAATAVTGAGLTVLNGPSRLLTGALPAEPSAASVAAVAIASGWATLLAGLLAAYARNALPPVVPPLVCLVAAQGLGASVDPLPGWYVPAAIALVVALLLTGRRRRPGPAVLVAATAIGAVAIGAAGVIGSRVPGGSPADARTLVDSRVRPCGDTSPLQQYNALRKGDPEVKLTGTTSRATGPLRLATLTRFDGSYWTVEGDYRLAGRRLPDASPAAARPVTVRQQVRVSATTNCLGWLVTAGRATRVSIAGLGVDEVTGDVAVPERRPTPAQYVVESVVNDVRADDVSGVPPASAPGPLTPAPPAFIQSWVQRTVAGRTSGHEKLTALYERFKSSGEFHYDEASDVPGGHGYYQIQKLLRTGRGTSEQYASAFAVMARHLGVDARVVMGFRPRSHEGNSFEVESRDVYAWAEVRFAALGWVPIDPSPFANRIGTRAHAPLTEPRPGQQDDLLRSPAEERRPPERSHSGAGHSAGAVPEPDGGPVPAWALVIAGMLALGWAAPAAKAARRVRRRRDRSPRRAVLGAWWETTDRLREAGVAVGPALTTGEVVRLVPDLREMTRLAALVDAAAYAPGERAADAPARAWATAAEVRRRLHAGMSAPRRVAAFFDPRPLFRGK
ncbi:MAG TPA: transglutaminaseTgpA domain-containing protein [Streptosporangiaceae bacterium]|nr:transglutaminaseTgpA domain-containing protein [Streptosporangiaceae bacterium]